MDFNQRQILVSLIIFIMLLLIMTLYIIRHNDNRKTTSVRGEDKEVMTYEYTS